MSAVDRAAEYIAGNGMADPEKAWGRCVIESSHLASHLAAFDHPTWLVRITGANYPGREHWALILTDDADAIDDMTEATVLDPTARQFGADLPHPYVRDLATWLDDMSEGMSDHLVVQVMPGDPNDLGISLDDHPVFEVWRREDIEPGPITYPWQHAAQSA